MYKKPVVMRFDSLHEGVYAYSGEEYEAPFVAEEPVEIRASYKLVQTNAWDGNKQYDFIFTNESSENVESVTVTVRCNGTVTSIGGNVSGTIHGDTAEVMFNNYGNGIEANTTVGPVYVAVTGEGDFSLE